jgi:hypothetical protein
MFFVQFRKTYFNSNSPKKCFSTCFPLGSEAQLCSNSKGVLTRSPAHTLTSITLCLSSFLYPIVLNHQEMTTSNVYFAGFVMRCVWLGNANTCLYTTRLAVVFGSL